MICDLRVGIVLIVSFLHHSLFWLPKEIQKFREEISRLVFPEMRFWFLLLQQFVLKRSLPFVTSALASYALSFRPFLIFWFVCPLYQVGVPWIREPSGSDSCLHDPYSGSFDSIDCGSFSSVGL